MIGFVMDVPKESDVYIECKIFSNSFNDDDVCSVELSLLIDLNRRDVSVVSI